MVTKQTPQISFRYNFKSVTALVALAAFTFVGCSSSTSSATATPTQTSSANDTQAMIQNDSMSETEMQAMESTSGSASASDTMEDGEVKVVKIEAGSFYYNPKEIRVKKGQKVRIELTGKDMMHDFMIDELNVKSERVTPGQTVTVEFTADQAGEFEYYCSVGQHRTQGQVGTLIVE